MSVTIVKYAGKKQGIKSSGEHAPKLDHTDPDSVPDSDSAPDVGSHPTYEVKQEQVSEVSEFMDTGDVNNDEYKNEDGLTLNDEAKVSAIHTALELLRTQGFLIKDMHVSHDNMQTRMTGSFEIAGSFIQGSVLYHAISRMMKNQV